MFTIWFRIYGKAYSIELSGIDDARTTWDILAKTFDMISSRP